MRDSFFELPNDSVEVWGLALRSLSFETKTLYTLLSSDERSRVERMRTQPLRDAFVMTRGSLRVILGRYLDISPESLQLSYGPKGKPGLKAGAETHQDLLEFNVAHSANLALFAFTRGCEVGVDIERVRELSDPLRVAGQFFSREEAAELADLLPEERERAFFQCWTRKEAFIKATGKGLSKSLDSFRVTVNPKIPASLVRTGEQDDDAGSWTLTDLATPPQYVASLAYRAAERKVRFTWMSERADMMI